MYPKMTKNRHFLSDMTIIFVQVIANLQKIQYAWGLKYIYTFTGLIWVNNKFYIPLMYLGYMVTMVTKATSTATIQIKVLDRHADFHIICHLLYWASGGVHGCKGLQVVPHGPSWHQVVPGCTTWSGPRWSKWPWVTNMVPDSLSWP